MKSMSKHVTRFWSEERSLTVFLILLIVEIFIIAPINRTGIALSLVNNIFFSLLLLVGLLTMTRHKALQAVVMIFVALAVATHWARLVFGVSGLVLLDGFLMLACTVGFLVIVLWQVYREGPVTAHRIQGAVAAYLLLSVIFAIAYGDDADMEVLQSLSEATGGQTVVGSVETIRKLYKILSTYF